MHHVLEQQRRSNTVYTVDTITAISQETCLSSIISAIHPQNPLVQELISTDILIALRAKLPRVILECTLYTVLYGTIGYHNFRALPRGSPSDLPPEWYEVLVLQIFII